jgi:hypothetical protein
MKKSLLLSALALILAAGLSRRRSICRFVHLRRVGRTLLFSVALASVCVIGACGSADESTPTHDSTSLPTLPKPDYVQEVPEVCSILATATTTIQLSDNPGTGRVYKVTYPEVGEQYVIDVAAKFGLDGPIQTVQRPGSSINYLRIGTGEEDIVVNPETGEYSYGMRASSIQDITFSDDELDAMAKDYLSRWGLSLGDGDLTYHVIRWKNEALVDLDASGIRPALGLHFGGATVTIGGSGEVVDLTYRPVSLEEIGEYPLISEQQALTLLKQCKAYASVAQSLGTAQSYDRVGLVYVGVPSYRPDYLLPAYQFLLSPGSTLTWPGAAEVDSGSQVVAVRDDYLTESPK